MASLKQFGLFVLLLHIISPSWCDDLKIFENTSLSADALMSFPARLEALEQTVSVIVDELQDDRSSCKEKFIRERDIVADIKQGRIVTAEKKMLELHDPAIVENIVRDMSANSDHDFGVLVNLAESVNSTTLKSRILLNLYRQVKENDHISTVNLIALAKCLSGKQNGHQHVGITAFNVLLDQIAKSAIATFVDVMKWQGDYQTNSKVRAIAADIAEWGDVSETVMSGLVSGVFVKVDSKKILEAVCSHNDTWQALLGVDTLIDKLKDTHLFKGSIALDIASHLNEFVTRADLHSTVRNYALRVLDKIPDCIVKLTSLTTVCFWNKHKQVFLVRSRFYYTGELVSIVTGPQWEKENTTISRAGWQPKRKDERFFFENISWSSILHASNVIQGPFKRVFSTRTEGDLDDKYAWILEPYGDSCFLKNSWNNEYLYASDAIFERDERKIAGTKDKRSGSADDNPDMIWQILSC